jgi:hypothetical protein
MTNTQITELATAIATAVVIALSTPEVAPITEVAEVAKSEPTAPKKAKKATKKAPRRTKAENSLLVKRINGRIANATKAVRHADATYEQMMTILRTATAITPAGWVSTHNQIARKADKLVLEIAAR